MPLSSMTGFARNEGDHEKFHWAWEIRSVNARNLDVRLRVPGEFSTLEAEARKVLGGMFKRGAMQVGLHLKRHSEAAELAVNKEALAQVVAAMEEVGGTLETQAPTLDGILALRGVLEVVEPEETEAEKQAQMAALLEGFKEAARRLEEARNQEGAAMEAVLVGQVGLMEKLTQDAAELAALTPEKIRTRLMKQVETLLEDKASLPEDRIAQEVALLVTKADVREELDRLKAHCEAARELLSSTDPVGRKLDFLTQEFNREANTLCSKSSDVALTRIGLELKSVVEQFREQVQNIE